MMLNDLLRLTLPQGNCLGYASSKSMSGVCSPSIEVIPVIPFLELLELLRETVETGAYEIICVTYF
jgi:hypothetical protein